MATSRIGKKLAPAPLLTCHVCQVTLTGKHQLGQHRCGKKHRAREARISARPRTSAATFVRASFPPHTTSKTTLSAQFTAAAPYFCASANSHAKAKKSSRNTFLNHFKIYHSQKSIQCFETFLNLFFHYQKTKFKCFASLPIITQHVLHS